MVGSYRDGRAAYGVVCIKDGKIVKTLSGSFKLQGGTRNVAGEIQGVLKAMEWSAKNGIKEICLHYDYEGLANWINGTWKAKIQWHLESKNPSYAGICKTYERTLTDGKNTLDKRKSPFRQYLQRNG